MSSILHVAAGLLIIFLLPGLTLINVMFPRRGELDPQYDMVYRITLGIGASVVIAIVVGFVLNAMSSEGSGYVTPGPLWAILLSLTAVFFALGWLRGAYPGAGYIHPALYRTPARREARGTIGSDFVKKRKLENLVIERERLLKDLEKFATRSSTSNPGRRLYYRKLMDDANARLKSVNEELRSLGKEDK